MSIARDEGRAARPSHPLERAAEAVVERLDLEGRPEGEALKEELEGVLDGIEAAREDRTPAPPGPSTADHVRLLRILRPALLDAWSDEDEDEDLLGTLRAFERYEQELLRWGTEVTVRDLLTPFSRKLLREVAHALRSPLGSMVALAGALREGRSEALGAVEAHQLGIIHRAALTAATMASDLLSATETGDPLEQHATFSIAELVQSVQALVEPVVATRGSRFEASLPEDPRRRTGPAAATTQALLTLALRAALMTRDATVRIEASVDGDEVAFVVVSEGVPVASPHEAEARLRVLRMSDDGDSFTISSDGLAIEAARAAVRRADSELELGATPSGHLAMAFRVRAPAAG